MSIQNNTIPLNNLLAKVNALPEAENLDTEITDHRDGTITVKMGKFTTEEMLLMEVLA